MAQNREDKFNHLQHIVGEMTEPRPKDLAMAQLASDFHKDKRQEELIDELTGLKDELADATEGLKQLGSSIDNLNSDTADVYNRLYGRLNTLTLVIAIATAINSLALIAQVILQFCHP